MKISRMQVKNPQTRCEIASPKQRERENPEQDLMSVAGTGRALTI